MVKMSKMAQRKLNSQDFHEACRNGSLKRVTSMISSENIAEIINTQAGVFGYTPLHEAANSRNSKLAEILIQNGALVDATSNGNYTPLHIAASIGDCSCINILLKHKANVTLEDEFGDTPQRAAIKYRRKKAARLLKTAEVKRAVIMHSKELGKMIESVNSGEDVTEKCFDECLELAVDRNDHFSAGFVLLRNPSNIQECFDSAMVNRSRTNTAGTNTEVCVMLLLCMAASKGDTELLHYLCLPDYVHDLQHVEDFTAMNRYLPPKYHYPGMLAELRAAVKKIDLAFPVSLACNQEKYEAAKIFLFNLYCSEPKLEADWHGLAISMIESSWISEICKYKKFFLGFNQLSSLPNNMMQMTNLLRLDLQHNNLVSIPGCLLQLPLLRNFNVSHNMLQELPEVKRWTSSLNILELQGNYLQSFPEEINGATIQYLNLAANQLKKIPLGLCKMTTLTSLDVSENKDIHELPLMLGKMINLTDLNLDGLQISARQISEKEMEEEEETDETVEEELLLLLLFRNHCQRKKGKSSVKDANSIVWITFQKRKDLGECHPLTRKLRANDREDTLSLFR